MTYSRCYDSFSFFIHTERVSLSTSFVDIIIFMQYICEINKIKSYVRARASTPAIQSNPHLNCVLYEIWFFFLKKMCEFIQFILKSVFTFIHHIESQLYVHFPSVFHMADGVFKKTQSHFVHNAVRYITIHMNHTRCHRSTITKREKNGINAYSRQHNAKLCESPIRRYTIHSLSQMIKKNHSNNNTLFYSSSARGLLNTQAFSFSYFQKWSLNRVSSIQLECDPCQFMYPQNMPCVSIRYIFGIVRKVIEIVLLFLPYRCYTVPCIWQHSHWWCRETERHGECYRQTERLDSTQLKSTDWLTK